MFVESTFFYVCTFLRRSVHTLYYLADLSNFVEQILRKLKHNNTEYDICTHRSAKLQARNLNSMRIKDAKLSPELLYYSETVY